MIKDVHKRKPSYGYHRIWKIIVDETGWVISANLVHKVCKILKIKSKAKHYKYKKIGEESIKYPNLINNDWNTTRPLEKITSDTTMIWFKKQKYDWTYYVDAFDDSIIGSDVKPYYYGASMSNHKSALNDMINNKIKRGYKDLETIFHTDQGSVYSSLSFNKTFENTSIIRSMSRAGTPTDNPIIESLNGWMKAELMLDFQINKASDISATLDLYVHYFNYERGVQDCSRGNTYHNRRFKEAAEARGLMVEHSDKYGWSHTAPSDLLLDWILNNNIFCK